MKILIISAPRTGSSSLAENLKNVLKYKQLYLEPYLYKKQFHNFNSKRTSEYGYPLNLSKNSIVKTMTYQVPSNYGENDNYKSTKFEYAGPSGKGSDNKGEKFREEHTIPASVIGANIILAIQKNAVKPTMKAIEKNYFQVQLSKKDDTKLDKAGLGSTLFENQTIFDSPISRLAGAGINLQTIVNPLNGKTIAEENGVGINTKLYNDFSENEKAQASFIQNEEIKKGARGGDCIQIVHTRTEQNCGSIYYESKRTKDFQPSWIEKFKADIRDKGANIGVLVTEVMPSDMDRFGLKEGIWICTYNEFKGLSAVLRQSIIKWASVKISQENRGDKMSLLYDFLTSNEFRLQMEGIVEGFSQMQLDLAKERSAMASIWKQREKQIEKVMDNSIGMHASIRGIAGNAIQSIPGLELGDGLASIEE